MVGHICQCRLVTDSAIVNLQGIVLCKFICNRHLEFSRESTEDISIWERVYWYGVEVGRCAQTIYGYTVEKNIGFATLRADVPDGAELTVGCNDSPAVVVSKVFC